MDWQPIETAPKDGTFILVCMNGYESLGSRTSLPTMGHPMTVAWRIYHPNAPGKGAWRDHNGHKQNFLTHWMPLPKAP